MKAWTQPRYGSPDVLELREVEKPQPGEQEVLVRVVAASINSYDLHLLRADPFLVRLMGGGMTRPAHLIPGADLAGRVDAVGPGVTRLKVGDSVYGCMGEAGDGAFAEYRTASEHLFVLKPERITFEEAAAVPMAAITAYQALTKYGQVQPGQDVAISGGSGGVGTFAVQIAKALGARVTAVCSTRNVDLMRDLGADEVIDYRREDFTQSGHQYDVIMGVNGYHPIGHYKRALKPGGIYIFAGGNNRQIFETLLLGPLHNIGSDRRVKMAQTSQDEPTMQALNDLLSSGQVRPAIDRCFPFEALPDAMRYMEQQHARAKIVLQVAPAA